MADKDSVHEMMLEDYQTDEAFRAYVDKFSKDNEVTPEIAVTHQIVKDVWEWNKKENKGVWRGIGT